MKKADGAGTVNGSILITGCSTGIGKDTAVVLREMGYDVIASARRQEDVCRLRDEGFKAVHVDNDDDVSIERGFSEAVNLAETGRVQAVLFNAGYAQLGAIEDVSVAGFERQLRTNVLGTHSMVLQACSHMRSFGGGRLVINSSVLGLVGMPLRGCYSASKGALELYADILRMELRDVGIEVVLIEPGPVYTRFRANALKHLKEHVELTSSRHAKRYQGLQRKLETQGPVVPFTMSSRRCGEIAARALTCARPKARYRVTVQTRVFSVLKRVLPTRWLDAIAGRG